MWQCINCSSEYRAMDSGDVTLPVIKYRSNRAFLCHWDHNSYLSHTQLRVIGVHEGDDLAEVAGCMLRLALWPTEELWTHVKSPYDKKYNEVLPIANLISNQDSEMMTTVVGRRKGVYQIAAHYRCGDKGYKSYDMPNYYIKFSVIPGLVEAYQPSTSTVSLLDMGFCLRYHLNH